MSSLKLLSAFCFAIAIIGNAQDVLTYEAEEVSTPEDAWAADINPKDKWNLWSKDTDAHKKWSGGKVLQSPKVLKDRLTPEAGAPVLHVVINEVPNGTWQVSIKHGRALAASLDGKQWRDLSKTGGQLGTLEIRNGRFECWVDDRFALKANPGFSYFDTISLSTPVPEKLGVVNGEFEFGKSWKNSGWGWWSREGDGKADYGEVELNEKEGPSGRCVHIEHPAGRDWALTNRGRLDVKPGEVFLVSAWMKCTDTEQAGVSVVALSGGQTLKWSIGSDGLTGTHEWKKISAKLYVPEDCDQIYVRARGSGKTNAWIDRVTLERGKPDPPRKPKPKVEGWAERRVEERLDRGLVATRHKEGVYLSWRLLPSDPPDVSFRLSCLREGGKQELLTREPVHSTDYLHQTAPQSIPVGYRVQTIVKEQEQKSLTPNADEWVGLRQLEAERSYISIPLQGDYTFQKAGIADLNGDGRYDFVIKQPNSNIDPYRFYWYPSPESYTLEAYLHDGTFLWKRKLGWSIERGIWYSPYVVFDFDGDGKAEVAVKTGEGDPRNEDGRVLKGAEYLSILDGMTGKEMARVPWPSRKGFKGSYAYNLASRNQLGIAYLDGKTPCIMIGRGTYTLMKLEAWQFHEGKLEQLWNWNSEEEPGGRYRGQGAHFMHCADVDEDGRDEVILGSCVIDDNGDGLWSTGMGHPDHCYLGDIDPSRPGLEIYYGMETRQLRNGTCLVEARTGKVIWGLKERTYHVHSTGLCADLDPLTPGVECYSGEKEMPKEKPKRWLHSAAGELLENELSWDRGLSPRAAYWDGDHQREILFRNSISNYHGEKYTTKIEGRQIAWADILGDWREEIITTVPGELRIYTTTIPANDRRVTLMKDHIYRKDVAHLAMGYPQVPMTSFVIASQANIAAIQIRLEKRQLKPGESTTFRVVVVSPQTAEPSQRNQEQGNRPGPVSIRIEGLAARAESQSSQLHHEGHRFEQSFKLTMLQNSQPFSPLSGKLTATCDDAGEKRKASVTIELEDTPIEGLKLEAESFTAQGGGEVKIREDKIGHSGKSLSHWDDKGHWLEWKYRIPESGNYVLGLRYATPYSTKRSVELIGRKYDVEFPATDGFSSTTNDWRHIRLMSKDGKPRVLKLKEGDTTIKMTNLDGQGTNLDYLVLMKQ
ncbi:MAG: FG-GAP-like repeat-containing protein [Planctomycetota bacterium]|nr:FG-GAP-like repeat-containing protein [Planctomycetota bacterium]MDP7249485.1 FG-GAP-like repeat-containing protein [Planctomycetota bacterium]